MQQILKCAWKGFIGNKINVCVTRWSSQNKKIVKLAQLTSKYWKLHSSSFPFWGKWINNRKYKYIHIKLTFRNDGSRFECAFIDNINQPTIGIQASFLKSPTPKPHFVLFFFKYKKLAIFKRTYWLNIYIQEVWFPLHFNFFAMPLASYPA